MSSRVMTGGRVMLQVIPAIVVAILLAGACGQEKLETRTFELQFLNPNEAEEMVLPYVYVDRPDAPGVVTSFSAGITVRETRDNLDRIQRVLEEYDRPKPGVRLHYQLIEADGASESDPRIADVEAALRELFRFEGYQLIAEAPMGAIEGSGSTQTMIHGPAEYWIRSEVQMIRGKGDAGAVTLNVHLQSSMGGEIGTQMTVPVNQTVVLGSMQRARERGALILTVRPELVQLPDSTG